MVDFPAELREIVVPKENYKEGYGDNVLRSQMDTGASKRRKRYTAVFKPLVVVLPVSSAQLDIFNDFYENDISHGALSFTYPHPRTGADVTVAFTKSPDTIQPIGVDLYTVQMDLEIIP